MKDVQQGRPRLMFGLASPRDIVYVLRRDHRARGRKCRHFRHQLGSLRKIDHHEPLVNQVERTVL